MSPRGTWGDIGFQQHEDEFPSRALPIFTAIKLSPEFLQISAIYQR